MTAAPLRLVTTDDRPDNPGPLPARPPEARDAGPGGHGGRTGLQAPASVPRPTRAGAATEGCGRRRSHGRKERAHRSLENRKERGFPQRPQPIVLHRNQEEHRAGLTDRRRAFVAFGPAN